MAKHIADQARDRIAGTRMREFTRIQREQGAGGPHPATRELRRRGADSTSAETRTREFLRRERALTD